MIILPTWAMDLFKSLDEINSKLGLLENELHNLVKPTEASSLSMGSRLKELRLKKGVSLQVVADAVGSSKPYIWELEQGKRDNPSINLLRRLAEYFEVNVSYLVD